MSSILASLNDGIVVADREGKCLLFNPQAEKIRGSGPRDVNPESWARDYGVFGANRSEHLSPKDNPLLRAMAGEASPHTEVFVRHSAVAGSTVAMTGRPLGGEYNDIMGGVAVLRDVTQQRELEVQLSQSQKMDAIGRLAGGVAHDFNNLLMMIQSYSALIREGLEASDAKRDDVDEILAAARRASALTKQLLAFSRKETVQPATLHLNDIVSGIEKMLQRIIGEEVALFTELSPALGLIRADAGQLACAEHGSTIDLLLTDVVMPECTGPQLARELTAQHPRLRVLYMSGYPGGAAKRSGSLEPGTPFVEKPFSPSILVERVCAALGEATERGI